MSSFFFIYECDKRMINDNSEEFNEEFIKSVVKSIHIIEITTLQSFISQMFPSFDFS